MSSQQVWLIRHGETEWSASGRHTSRTDVPLTVAGEAAARELGARLAPYPLARVLSSPRQRALRTAVLAGYGDRVEVSEDLAEWDYGDYEGITTPEIRRTAPNWSVFTAPTPGGETAEQISTRLDRVVAEVRGTDGDVALFAHGHSLRALAARWLDEPVEFGRHLALATASVCCLGSEREAPAILLWNDASGSTPH